MTIERKKGRRSYVDMGSEIAMTLDAMKKSGTLVKVSERTDIRKLGSNDASYYNLSLSRVKRYGDDAMSDHIPKLLWKDPGVKNPTFPERMKTEPATPKLTQAEIQQLMLMDAREQRL